MQMAQQKCTEPTTARIIHSESVNFMAPQAFHFVAGVLWIRRVRRDDGVLAGLRDDTDRNRGSYDDDVRDR